MRLHDAVGALQFFGERGTLVHQHVGPAENPNQRAHGGVNCAIRLAAS